MYKYLTLIIVSMREASGLNCYADALGAFPSTLSAIKEQCVSGKGEVVSKVSSAVGGIKNALDRCELPRNESQATYVKRQLKTNSSPLLLVSATNELSVVMHKA